MQVKVQRKPLIKLLERCVAAIDQRSPVPILTNVLLVADTNGLHLSAQSLQQSVSGVVEADVNKKGSFLVDARKLLDRVKSMPSDEVRLEQEKYALTIKGDKHSRKFVLATIPSDDYPKFAKPGDDSVAVTIPSSVLSSLLDATMLAISTDDTRIALNSLLIEFENGMIRAVSTDGHRLHKCDVDCDVTKRASILVPLQAVRQIKAMASGHDGYIELRTSGSWAFWDAEGVRIGVRISDAQFPPYEQVIPTGFTVSATVDRAGLADSLRSASGVVGKERGVKLTVGCDMIAIEAMGGDDGEFEDNLNAATVGDTVTGAAPKYLLDALSSITSDDVELRFGGELDPIVVVPKEKESKARVTCIVMPMRV